jgi:hypothetical protein
VEDHDEADLKEALRIVSAEQSEGGDAGQKRQ